MFYFEEVLIPSLDIFLGISNKAAYSVYSEGVLPSCIPLIYIFTLSVIILSVYVKELRKETANMAALLLGLGFFFIVNKREKPSRGIRKGPEQREKADWTWSGQGCRRREENNGNSKRGHSERAQDKCGVENSRGL